MNTRSRSFLFSLVSIAVVMAYLATAVSVRADDGTPPVPTEEPALPPTEEPTPTDIPAQEPALQEESSVEQILSQVPEGTDIVVLDENGQPQPLSSQEAADIIINGDPMWCPAGVLPGDPTCTASFTMFTGAGGLIAALETLPFSGPGTIYVESSYNATIAGDYGSDIVFAYNNVLLTDLVFQGGWDFTSNAVVGTSTFDLGAGYWLVFLDWGGYGDPGNLTLKDINVTISGGLYIGVDSDTPTASVTLDNVSASNHSGGAGAVVIMPGNVTVLNSDFDSNTDSSLPGQATGLVIVSDGIVTLNNVSARNNNGIGVVIVGYSNPNPASVTIENSVFNSNHSMLPEWGSGLILSDTGNATVRCSQFINNSLYGIVADGPGTIIDDSNTFSGNGSADSITFGGGTLVQAASGCGDGGEGGRRKNKDIGPILPQMIAVTTPCTLESLPADLPEGKTFAACMTVKLLLNGEEIDEAPGGVQISFDIPASMEPPFTVLSWNGTEWVEVLSAVVDGNVVFSVTSPGTFVLVTP